MPREKCPQCGSTDFHPYNGSTESTVKVVAICRDCHHRWEIKSK